jgi:hypothetical protein
MIVSLPAPIGSHPIITATVPRYFIALLPKVAPQESVSPTRLDFPLISLPLFPQKPAARGKALFCLSFWPAYIRTISYIYIHCILPSYIHTYTLAHSFCITQGTRLPPFLDRDLDSTHIPDPENYNRRKRSYCVCFSWPDILLDNELSRC